MIPVLALLASCPAPAPEPASRPPTELVEPEPVKEPPLPPPAPVDIAFAWPDGSACLMATRRTETLSTPLATISTLTGVGSGVVSATAQADGTWTVALEDRSGTARHTPSDADLLVALEEVHLGLEPTLRVAADGVSVLAVDGLEGAAGEVDRLDKLTSTYSVVGQAFWKDAIRVQLAEEVLDAGWSRAWWEGWGFAFGHRFVADEPLEVPSFDGRPMTVTYRDVVPCKFNEAEPLCVRIVIDLPSGSPETPEARLRVALPPGVDASAEPALQTADRVGELVIEVASGLPWRWTVEETESHTFRHQGEDHQLFVRRKQDVSCDWRVAE